VECGEGVSTGGWVCGGAMPQKVGKNSVA